MRIKFFLAAVAVASAVGVSGVEKFAPDFARRETLTSSPVAKFTELRLNFVPGKGSSKALLLRRGAPIPAMELARPLERDEKFGWSFDFTRLDDNSSFGCMFTDGNEKYTGIFFVENDGSIKIHNGRGVYEKTKLVIPPRRRLHLSVEASPETGTIVLDVPGIGRHETGYVFHENLRIFRFWPGAPEGNRSTIENFELHRDKTAAAPGAKPAARQVTGGAGFEIFAPDFSDRSTLTSSPVAKFTELRLNFVAASDGGKAMEIRRGAPIPMIELSRPLQADEDFGYSFDVTRVDDNGSFGCLFKTREGENYAGVIFVDNSGCVNVYNAKGLYDKTPIVIPPGRRCHVSVTMSADSRRIIVEVSGIGKYEGTTIFREDLRSFRFWPGTPEGNRNRIENFELHRRPKRLILRENGAKGARLDGAGADGAALSKIAGLVDGSYRDPVLLPEKCTVTIYPEQRIDAAAVQIYGGNPEFAINPSGACAPREYTVEGLINGAWQLLAEGKNLPDVCAMPGLRDEERCFRHDFRPAAVDAIRIRFTASHDTGTRMTGPVAEDKRALYIREVEVLSTKVVDRKPDVRDVVRADYRLPVWRNADSAKLVVAVSAHPGAPKTADVTVKRPDGTCVSTTRFPLAVGRNELEIKDVGKLPPGRYMTEIATSYGTLRRLLRVERVPAVTPPREPVAMSGKILLFTPDDYALASSENLEVKVSPVAMKELARTPSEDKLLHNGNELYVTTDGRIAMKTTDIDFKGFMFGGRSSKFWIADSLDGKFTEVSQLPPRRQENLPIRPFRTGSFPKPPAGTKFEFYDSAVHGEMPLGNLSYVYSYQPADYGCVKAPARTYWVTGRTADGKWVLMMRKPLFTDVGRYGEEDFDDGFMTNDNFGGMWLSPDGKECLWAQGQTVKRSEPYNIPFDNLSTGMRLMGIYSTSDGSEWRYRGCITVPDESDSPGAQHYGVMMMPIAAGDLMLAYLYAYDADAQQIYIELNYSRDGIHFYRFPGSKAFVRSTKPGEWYFNIFANHSMFRDGDDYCQQASYCCTLPHFYAEALMGHDKLSQVTASDFEKRFANRELAERWTYFRQVGGYEGLAELTRHGFYSSGVMRFRADGWCGLCAGERGGSFTTRRFTGGGKLFANAEAAGGVLEIELVDADGKAVRQAKITGNGSRQSVFDLPETGEYRLRGKMKNSKLYALYFDK